MSYHDGEDDELRPEDHEEPVVFDWTIKVCPLCGSTLTPTWEGKLKRCPQPPAGCGCHVRNGLVTAEELFIEPGIEPGI